MEQKIETERVQGADAAPGRGGKKKLDVSKELVALNLRDTGFGS